MVATLTNWVENGYELVIVYPTPEQDFHANALLYGLYSSASSADELPILSTSYDVYKQRVASSYAALDQITGPKVRRVYPARVFCREETGRCLASDHDRIYFGVDSHVTHLGSDMIVREVAEQLQLQVPDSFRK